MKNHKNLYVAFLTVAVLIWSLGSAAQVLAFSIRAVFTSGSNFAQILFDANVATSTVTSTAFTLNAGTPAIISVFVPSENPKMVALTATSAINIGDTITVDNSVQDVASNANNTTVAQKILPGLKLAEVRAMGFSPLDEYIMIYNSMDTAYDVVSNGLYLHVVRPGNEVSMPLSFITQSIPDHGFYLITSAFGYSASISPDATYSTSTDLLQATNTAVYISTSPNHRVNIIDKVEWGTAAQVTTSTNATSTFAATVVTSTLLSEPANNVPTRKASNNSTAATMKSGGADSSKGNGFDTRDNANDFVLLNNTTNEVAVIKNSNSPKEFPFGGGQSDLVAPTVTGSFPDGSAGQMVPTDMAFIGFTFSEPVNGGSVNTSSVSLTVQGQSTNLCSSASYDPMRTNGPAGQCTIPPSTLVASTTYVFTIKGASSSPNVTDWSGNALFQPAGSNPGQHGNANHDYEITLIPSTGFSVIPQTPPSVIGTFPNSGAGAVATNITKVFITFSQAMNSSSFSGVSLALATGGSEILNTASSSLINGNKTVAIPLTANLAANTQYRLAVPNSVMNSNSIGLPSAYTAQFTTGSGADTSGPQVLGKMPNIASGVPVNAIDIHISTDDILDASTITSSTFQVADAFTNLVPGTINYDPTLNEIIWLANNVFQLNTQYAVSVNASGSASAVKNISNLALQDTDGTANNKYQFSFTTANSADGTGPGIAFANANSFSVAITFNEAVKQTEAEILSNYSLTSGGNPVTLSAMNGHTIAYDSVTRTVKINNVALTAGNSFGITVSNVHDLSNNVVDPGSATFGGTVQSATFNGGEIGMGGGYVMPTGDAPIGFSSATYGYVPQPDVRPFNTLAGFTSNYMVDLPISTQIPANGQIVLTFPSTFTLANAAKDSFSPANNDINGPGIGAVVINTVTGNDTSHTVTVALGGVATRNESGDQHDFLHFDLSGIVNSPIPKDTDTSGYTIDIRTVNGTTTLESFSSRPFFVTAAGGGNLTVSVGASGASIGTATIYLFSPSTGPLSTSTTSFSSGNATATFAGIPNGYYGLSTDAFVALGANTFLGQPMPRPININGTTTASLTLLPSGSVASSVINIHASAAGKKISVFAGGPAGFMDIATTTINGTTSVVTYYPADGDYMVGVGPQMNKTFMGPPPAPDYVMPMPVNVNVASAVASRAVINFDLVAADKFIDGTVQDNSGKVVSNAGVYAYSPQGGFGTFGQSGPTGNFRLSVAPGSYKLGANAPGFPSASEISVIIDSVGNVFANGSTASTTNVILKLSKPDFKISGTVRNSSSSPIQGAAVWAYCDPSVNNNACFGPNGHSEAQTDSSGAYTLYVGNGTWRVGAYIPGYGQQPEIIVVISGADASNKDIQPSTTVSFKSVSGTVCTNTGADCTGGTGVANAFVRIEGVDASGNFYSNSTVSDNNGAYTFSNNIPSGAISSYRVRGFAPNLGELPPTAAFSVTVDVTGKDLVVRAGRKVNVEIASVPASFEIFMRFTNTSSGISNFMNFRNNTSGTINMPNGGNYQVEIHSPGFSLGASDVSLLSGTATYSTSTGQLSLASGSDTVVLRLTFPASTAISGTVKDNNDVLIGNAWVDISDSTGVLHFGSQANSSGTYSLAVQDGSYMITAYAPGYIPVSQSLSLASGVITLGNTTTTASAVNLTVTKTSLAITGTIYAGSASTRASYALVKAVQLGGGMTVAPANADGTYSLPVKAGTWTVSAIADGYQSVNYGSNPVIIASSSVSGVNITLTTKVSLAASTIQPMTPSQGGTVRNALGTMELTVPASALGSSANTGQIKVSETNNIISTASARPLGKGHDIRAFDSSSNAVTTLNSNITINLDISSSTFAADGITSTSTANKLKLAYFDSSLGDWVPIASTLSYENASGTAVTPNSSLSNVDHISLNGSVGHLTVFGTIIPTDSVAPSAPTGVTVTALSASSIRASWTAPTTNSDNSALTDLMEFEIYRDTSATGNFTTQVNTSQVASGTTTFTDTSVSAGTTYYYKVSAADTSGNESTKSSASSGVAPVAAVQSGVPGGGGGGGYTPPTPTATTTAATTTPTTTPSVVTPSPAPTAAVPTLPAQAISAIFKTTLRLASKGIEVTRLQQLLAQDKEIYPEGLTTGYFGKLTEKAIQRFQIKYKIVSSGTPATTGFGVLGPKTRAKILEVFGVQAPVQPPAAPAAAAGTIEILRAKIQELQKQVLELMLKLQEMLKKKP